MHSSTLARLLALTGALWLAPGLPAQIFRELPETSRPAPPEAAPVPEDLLADLAQVQERIQLAQNGYGGGAVAFGMEAPRSPTVTVPSLPQHSLFGSVREAPEVLLWSSSAIPSDHQSELREDMAIMARVLERALKDKLVRGMNRAMGVPLVMLPGASPTQAIYLEDYGVIFNLRVGFPLLPAPERDSAERSETQPENTEWEAARRELFGDPTGDNRYGPFAGGLLDFERAQTPTEPYSRQRVEELQESLFLALRQAGQIRHLRPTDHLLITVAGAAAGSSPREREVRVERRLGTGRSGSSEDYVVWSGSPRNPEGGTLMTLRVAAEAVREFAAGTIDLAQLREGASVRIYGQSPSPGY